jgi:hypothetical protein
VRYGHCRQRSTKYARNKKIPLTPWKRVWHNQHNAPIQVRLKSVWYIVIHELTPPNERLAPLWLAESDRCSQFGRTDTLPHLILDCGTRKIIWTWTRTLIASWLRCDPREVSEDWAIRPCFQIWQPQKHAPMAWLLAQLVDYCLQQHEHLHLQDYMNFLREARWKQYAAKGVPLPTGRYLDIFNMAA